MSTVSHKILRRVYFLFGGMALFALLILLKVGKIQFFEYERWTAAEEQRKLYYKDVIATRGSILSDDGDLLATSLPYFRVGMDPTVPDPERIENFDFQLHGLAANLAAYFGEGVRDADYYEQLIRQAKAEGDRHVYLIRRPINYQELKMVRTWPILREGRFKGGMVIEKLKNKRFYPYKDLARITLGIIMNDTTPIKGLEYSFQNDLRGKDGQLLVRKIAGGVEMPVNDFDDNHAVDGHDLVTTLNVRMQDIVENAVARAVKKHNANYGVAILMEVKTGQVKAIANYPETYNYAFATQIEPGSTFKLASAMALLQDRLINIRDTIDTGDKGYVMIHGEAMKDHVALGKLSFEDAFVHSSNIAFAQWIEKYYGHQPALFIEHLKKFGLLDPVNKQIIGEAIPFVTRPNDRLWNLTTLPWMSIGYNSRMTPLQILAFYNAVANNGYRVEPYLVSQVRDNSRIIKEFNPKKQSARLADEWVIKAVQQMMKGVVEDGTARRIRTSSYQIAGKTGTVKKVKNGAYTSDYQASFCGYFPADNPKYSCYILIDEPSVDEFYGGTVAAPVFREISDQIYSLDLELQQEFKPGDDNQDLPVNPLMNRDNADPVFAEFEVVTSGTKEYSWVKASRDQGRIGLKGYEAVPDKMPDVRGMSSRDALILLESMGLEVSFSGNGRVKEQSLNPGSQIWKAKKVILTLG